MDLGIRNRRALICASSKGLGYASALALAKEGVAVTILARGHDTLQRAADSIHAETGVSVTPVVADVSTPEGRAAALAACPDPDILINNASGPRAGNFRDFTRDDWIKALDANMLSAIELIKATVDPMINRGFGRIINITASAVRVPLPILPLSNGARAGLTGFVASIAQELIAHNVTINNLLPGPFDTDRFMETVVAAAKRSGRNPDDERAARIEAHPAKRVGRPMEFGATCAFMCSDHAGYITGQNILLDGGKYPTTF